MGQSASQPKHVNASESLGYPLGHTHLQKLAEKASKTFPPQFTGVAQTGNVETVEGNRAVVTGRNALSNAGYNGSAVSGFLSHDHPTADMLQKVCSLIHIAILVVDECQ